MLRRLLKLLVIAVVFCAFVFLIQFWLQSKQYVFSEEVIVKIAEKYAVKSTTDRAAVKEKGDPDVIFKKIHSELKSKYTGHILPEKDLEWVFVNAGGWMGSICILHASLTEYVLFFGTALDTAGHSGRYWANVTDTLLMGEFHQWREGEITAKIHKPGATVRHLSGEVAAVNFKAGTWAMEYCRGFIPSALGFALSDTIFSTQDFITLFHTLRIYTKAMVNEVGYYIAHPHELIG